MRQKWNIRTPKLIAAVLAAALLVLGVPQTIGSTWKFALVEWDGMIGVAPPTAAPEVEAKAVALETIDSLLGDPEARLLAGALRLSVAYSAPVNSSEFFRNMNSVIDDLQLGLARAPANTLAWTQMTHANLAIRNRDRAAKALHTSFLFGPHEPQLSLWRAELGLQLGSQLDPVDRDMLDNEIDVVWKRDPQDILNLTVRRPDFIDRISLALSAEPNAAAFIARMKARH